VSERRCVPTLGKNEGGGSTIECTNNKYTPNVIIETKTKRDWLLGEARESGGGGGGGGWVSGDDVGG